MFKFVKEFDLNVMESKIEHYVLKDLLQESYTLHGDVSALHRKYNLCIDIFAKEYQELNKSDIPKYPSPFVEHLKTNLFMEFKQVRIVCFVSL